MWFAFGHHVITDTVAYPYRSVIDANKKESHGTAIFKCAGDPPHPSGEEPTPHKQARALGTCLLHGRTTYHTASSVTGVRSPDASVLPAHALRRLAEEMHGTQSVRI